MAVLSLVGIDAKQWEPLAVLALAGVAGYFLVTSLQKRNAGASQSTADLSLAAAPDQALQDLQQIALLQGLEGLTSKSTTTTGPATSGNSGPALNTSSTVGTAAPGSV